MDVLMMASGRFALPLLNALRTSPHRLTAVVSQPDRPKGRGLRPGPTPVSEYCAREQIPLFRPETVQDVSFLREIRALSPEVIVCAAYGQKLSDDILSLPRHVPLNVHASLLPRHRGAAPIARAILSGDARTGVTICRMVRRLDAGPIYAQEEVEIGPDETTPELEARLADRAALLLLRVLDEIAAGTVTERPQDESQATLAPKFRPEEGRLRWNRPARELHNVARALQPQPRAHFFLERRRMYTYRTRPEDSASPDPPGTILEAGEHGILVRCGEGALRLLDIHPESGRRMPAADFLHGHPLRAGMVLG
jgi:methionyl-tRNA formyltransferase